MPLRRYVASGRGGPASAVLVLAVSLVCGLVAGAIEGVVNRWFSLFLLFPMLVGLAAGLPAAAVIKRRQLRAPVLALVLGIAGGVAGYLAIHAAEYARFRSVVSDTLRGQRPGANDAEVAAAIDAALIAEAGQPGLRGYLTVAARQGVSVKRVGVGDDDGITFTGTGAWIVWLGELLIAAGVAGLLTRRQAAEPFCEACTMWYGSPSLVAAGGAGTKAARRQMIAALDHGDVDAAAAAFHGPRDRKHSFAITANRCMRCGTESYLSLKRLGIQRRAQPATVETWMMTRDELARFRAALSRGDGAAKAAP